MNDDGTKVAHNGGTKAANPCLPPPFPPCLPPSLPACLPPSCLPPSPPPCLPPVPPSFRPRETPGPGEARLLGPPQCAVPRAGADGPINQPTRRREARESRSARPQARWRPRHPPARRVTPSPGHPPSSTPHWQQAHWQLQWRARARARLGGEPAPAAAAAAAAALRDRRRPARAAALVLLVLTEAAGGCQASPGTVTDDPGGLGPAATTLAATGT